MRESLEEQRKRNMVNVSKNILEDARPLSNPIVKPPLNRVSSIGATLQRDNVTAPRIE